MNFWVLAMTGGDAECLGTVSADAVCAHDTQTVRHTGAPGDGLAIARWRRESRDRAGRSVGLMRITSWRLIH
jgi:hypothetical protein